MNIKLNLKIFVRFLLVVTYVLTAVTFTLQRVGLMKKGKQQKCSSFSKLSLSNVAFVSKVSITLFPFLSIYLTYLFLTCVIMCLYTIGKYWNWISKVEWIWTPILLLDLIAFVPPRFTNLQIKFIETEKLTVVLCLLYYYT